MLVIGKVHAASGRIEWARGTPARFRRLLALIRARLAEADGREFTTEAAHQLVSGYRRDEVEYALSALYLSAEVSLRPAYEPVQPHRSDYCHRCYWSLRRPRGPAAGVGV